MRKKNRSSLFIVLTGIIISVSRYIIGNIKFTQDASQHQQIIVAVMAAVNVIALGFVLLFLFNDFHQRCSEKIKCSGIETRIKDCCTFVLNSISFILLATYLFLGVSYVAKYRSASLNDVLSIIALTISIASNGMLEEYSNSYYKMIVKISSKVNKLDLKKRNHK